MTRIESEKNIIEIMIRLYCRRRLGQNELPQEYQDLLSYAHKRLDHCKFGENKTSCKRCPIHCYAPAMRSLMRQVMRWCGPRMLLYHPIITIKHYIHL
ncbi:MAG: nitrous oxide-stimulated promoter family protein [Marinilabiliaceae bacterium]|nr:nitrous oxide-stimulated promoter family protein [Bacteroidales bacterium]MDY4521223.1 nitrous oxide-stimulated promoter family protein [Bacteroidales bacterium]